MVNKDIQNEILNSNRICLFEEYRLIERSEHEVNGAWKGAHVLLFFLAFVFGSFCTFCFHMLMYMFDEKCVLFPELQTLTSMRQNVIYDFIPLDQETDDMPVEFLSTQWMEKSACYLPTYVPLVSGIFGLVWTTMFLMCSTGGRTLTGLQRPWRVLPPVFIFSLAMGGVCIYSSTVTHNGLEALCLKLSEITGSPTCTYTVNVATLVYERRIRGVYQATRLTILSAWLHTSCWLLSAVLALVRVLMVVDFQLVRINVDLIGDLDAMLENQEKHMHTVSPDSPDRWIYTSDGTSISSMASTTTNRVQFVDKGEDPENRDSDTTNMLCMLYYNEKARSASGLSLVPEERNKLARKQTFISIDKRHYFIAELLFDLVDNLSLPMSSSSSTEVDPSLFQEVVRQDSQSHIVEQSISHKLTEESIDAKESEQIGTSKNTSEKLYELKSSKSSPSVSSPKIKKKKDKEGTSSKLTKKSNLKHASVQTDQKSKKKLTKKSTSLKVQISAPKEDTTSDTSADNAKGTSNKKSQTPDKEKQD